MNTHKTLVSSLRATRATRSIRALAGAALASLLLLAFAPSAAAATVSGTLIISDSDAITTNFASPPSLSGYTFANGGTILIGPGLDLTFDGAGGSSNRVNPANGITISFFVDDNSILTFSNNNTGGTNVNGGVFAVQGANANSKLIFTAATSGSYIFDHNVATGNGGALSATGNNGAVYIANALFQYNTAAGTNGGGGLFTSAATAAYITLANVAFLNNSALQGGGYSNNAGGSATVPMPISITNALFDSNTATATGGGGAVYNGSGNVTYTFTDVLFKNNVSLGVGGAVNTGNAAVLVDFNNVSFLNNQAATNGGAIFMYGGTTNYNVAATTSATIAGNTAGATPAPNGIYLTNNGSPLLVFNIDGALEMLDPIYGYQANTATETIQKTGAGVWNLGGTSAFLAANGTPTLAVTNFSIDAGALHLYRANENGKTVAAGSVILDTTKQASGGYSLNFSVNNGATLSAGGGNIISTFSGTITLGTNTNLDLDLGFFANPLNSAANLLTLNGLLSVNWADINLNLLNPGSLPDSPANGATYNLINLGANTFTDTIFSSTTGMTDGYSLILSFDKTTLQLLYGTQDIALNRILTWTGFTNNSWLGANWTADSGLTTNETFDPNDIVNLDSTNPPPATPGDTTTIAIGSTPVTIGGMYVSGTQSYALTGAGITAETGLAANGKLTLGARAADGTTETAIVATPAAFTGVLDLTALDTNTFAGGLEIDSGALRIATLAQLGAPLSQLYFLGTPGAATTGTLILASDITFDSAAGAPNRLAITPGKSGALSLESGKTATFTNNTAGAITLGLGSNLTLAAADDARYLFTNNTGGVINIAAPNTTLTLANASFLDNTSGPAITIAGVSLIGNVNTINLNVSENATSRFAGSGTSIYIGNISPPTTNNPSLAAINIAVGAGGTLDMLDPIIAIVSTAAVGNGAGAQVVKTGAGIWNLAGSSTFSKFGGNGSYYAGITVTEGELYLYGTKDEATPISDPNSATPYYPKAASLNFSVPNNAGALKFTLNPGATLGIGGGNTINYITTVAATTALNNATISLMPGSILDFKLDNATATTDATPQTAMLTINTPVNMAGVSIITGPAGATATLNPIISLDYAAATPALFVSNTYNLLTLNIGAGAGGFDLFGADPTNALNAILNAARFGDTGMTNADLKADLHYTAIFGLDATTNTLWVSFADFLATARVLDWTGLDATTLWQGNNWTLTGDATATPATFTDGDVVNLAPTTTADANNTNTITLDPATPATASAINITGAQNYIIDGATTAGLAADATTGDLGGAGKLTLGAKAAASGALDTTPASAFTGTLDLTKTAANNFAGGVDIYTGALLISAPDQLGATLSALTFKGDAAAPAPARATLQIAAGQNVTFDGAGSGTAAANRLTMTAAGDFVIEDGATLTFSNNTPAASGGAINITAGGNLTMKTGADARLEFSYNKPTGTTFDGGAINVLTGGTLVIDATAGGFLFANNTAGNRGGAVFGNGTGGSAAIILYSGTFSGNSTTTGNGGALAAIQSARIEATDILFTTNTGATGGALFINSNATALVQSATFLNNTSLSANNGGGAAALQNATKMTLKNVAFIGNTASGTGAAIGGGAIYSNSANILLDITDATFTSNTATISGGAIYLSGGTFNLTVSDNATTLFADNKAGPSSTPNSIYYATATTTATINIGSNAALDMLDPMTAADATLLLTQTGSGAWNLGGDNTLGLTPTGAANIQFTITTGTLHLYRANETDTTGAHTATTGNLTLNGATSAFTLANNAALSAGGANTIAAPAITLGDTSILTLDLTAATPAAPDNTGYSVLTLNATAGGTLTSNWTQTLNLLNLDTLSSNGGDTYNLITLLGGPTFGADATTFTNITGLDAGYTLQLNAPNGNILQLLYAAANNVLTWTGAADGSWTGPTNWMTATLPATKFAKGDIINLADDTVDISIPAPTTTTLTVDTTTSATIAGMFVSGTTNYTITGANIVADGAIGSFSGSPAATGQLILGARAHDDASAYDANATYTGTLTLDNAANTFTNGIVINTGELIGNAANLAIGEGTAILDYGVLTFNQTTAAGDATYAAILAGTGTINKTGAATLTLTADNSAFNGLLNINQGSLILSDTAAKFGGDVNVNAGALLGGNGAFIGATRVINIETGATLMAGHTHNFGAPISSETLTIEGALNLNTGATLFYDLYTGRTIDPINVGTLSILGSGTIDINAAITGTYTLIAAANSFAADATTVANASAFAVTKNGDTLTGSRVNATTSADDTNTKLLLKVAVTNISSTWTGAAGNTLWSTDDANWHNPADNLFYNGDSVTFNDPVAPAATTITVDLIGVTAAGMTVNNTANTYTFEGGAITTSTLNTTLAGTPDATGKLIKQGSGNLIFKNIGPNNFEEGIDLQGGTLTGNTDTLRVGPTASITTAADTTLVFDQANLATYSGNITGGGNLVKQNAGNLTLDGLTTYTGTTTISAQALSIPVSTLTLANANQIASSTAVVIDARAVLNTGANVQVLNQLSGAGNITAAAALTLSNSAAATTYSGVITGDAPIIKLGANTLTLAGDNTTTGPLTITEGAIQLGDGSTAAGSVAGDIAIAANATLALDHGATAFTLGNTISGAGLIDKLDAGALTLTANSSAFGGTTSVSSGGLNLAANSALGAATSLLSLAPNTTLSGNGTIGGNVDATGGAVTITIHDTAAPIATTSTLTIGGTLFLGNATTLNYAFADNQTDLLKVGALTTTGTGAVNLAPAPTGSGTFTLIESTANIAATATNFFTTLNGNPLVSGRVAAVYELDPAQKNLLLALEISNVAGLVWDGTNTATWSVNHPNWQTNDIFLNGDTVIFDTTAAGAHDVAVDTAGVTARAMTVASATYTYTGGAITTSATTPSSLPAGEGDGKLTLTGNANVTLSNTAPNNFESGIDIAAGASLTGNADTLHVGTSLATPSVILNNGSLTFNQPTAAGGATYDAAITGAGSLTKLGAGALTLADAAYTAGLTIQQGALTLADTAATTRGAIAIAAGATLNIHNAAAYTIQNALTGAGLLDIALTAPAGAVNFTTAALGATPFTGTVALGASTFALDATNAAALANATLALNAGNTTTIAAGTQSIGNLSLNGAALIFSTTIPADLAATGIITTATLAIGTSGTIQVTIPTGATDTASTGATLFAQATGTTIDKLVTATTVTGSANIASIKLIDQNGADATANARTATITQSAANIATGTYTYKLDATNGLNVNYALASLTIDTGKTLALAPAAGDTGAFNALISGNGNLTIDATLAPVTLGAANNFTGATTVTAGTLVAGASNALGTTTANTLVLAANTTFDLNGKTQTLATVTAGAGSTLTLGAATAALTVGNTLNTDPTSTLNLAGGTLNTAATGTLAGALAGPGALNITAGNLTVNGANTTLTAPATISTGATLTMGNLAALGTNTPIANAGTLNVNNTTPGALDNTLTGPGALNLTGAPTTLNHANPDFHGQTNLNATVTAADTAALGTGPIAIGDTNPAATLTYTAPGTIANNITGANGTLNLAAAGSAGAATTLTGNTTNLGAINALAGSSIVAASQNALAANKLTMTDATVTLAAPNPTLGAVTMAGASTLAFAKNATPGNTATLASLAATPGSTPTLVFNTNISTGASDTLNITGPATGDYTIDIENTPNQPAPTAETTPIHLFNIAGANTITAKIGKTSGLTFSDAMNVYDLDDTDLVNGTLHVNRGEALGPTGGAIVANATNVMPLTWFAELDTISKRLGDLHIAPRETPGLDIWMRGYAQRVNVNNKDTLVAFDETQYGTEIGADYGGHPTGHGAAIYIGAFLGYGGSTRDIAGMNLDNGDTTSAHAGAYITIINPDGWYVDIVGKYNHFKNTLNATSDNGLMNANYTINATGFSAEAGKRIELGRGWYVTPAAQAAVAHIEAADYNTRTADPRTDLRVTQDPMSTRQLRAGAQLGYKLATKDGQIIQPYAKLYAARQWTNGGVITVYGLQSGLPDLHGPYYSTIQGSRIETGLGVNWQLTKAMQLYFDYDLAWARDYKKPYGLTLGANYAW